MGAEAAATDEAMALAGRRTDPERHDLVWLAQEAIAAVRVADPARAAVIRRWLSAGRPAVATRRVAGVAESEIALGIALPASRGRARVALAAPRAGIVRVEPPLPLAAALTAAPGAWRPALDALDAEARAAGLPLRVFGSLAWQRLTGEAYLREGSDVDLLVPADDENGRARALALLQRWTHHAAPRLDGELRVGRGRAVAWREVLAAPARVLVKASAAVTLEPLEAVLGGPAGARP